MRGQEGALDLWPMLLEKALAKLYGSYESQVYHALSLSSSWLVGAPLPAWARLGRPPYGSYQSLSVPAVPSSSGAGSSVPAVSLFVSHTPLHLVTSEGAKG